MSTTCNNGSEHALWVAEMIEKYGHAIVCVGTGDCRAPGCRCEPEPVPWSYRIGLVDDGLPELVAFGLDEEGSLIMLNWAAGRGLGGLGRCNGVTSGSQPRPAATGRFPC
jgi:hypothetical protein